MLLLHCTEKLVKAIRAICITILQLLLLIFIENAKLCMYMCVCQSYDSSAVHIQIPVIMHNHAYTGQGFGLV